MILDGESEGPVALAKPFGVGVRVIGRIIQHLNLQQLPRILDFRYLVDEPLDDIALVENRQLNRHSRKLVEPRYGLLGRVLSVLKICSDNVVSVKAVNRENRKNAEIRDQER